MRCGLCGEAFNALPRLSDVPPTMPQNGRGESAKPVTPPPPAKAAVEASAEVEFRIPIRPRDEPEPDALFVSPAEAREIQAGIEPEVDGELPPWLTDEELAQRSRAARGWGMACFLLLVAGLGLAAWFNRDLMYAYYPPAQQWVERLCARFGCDVHRYRAPGAITLQNRDVRVHPVYQGALLINATLINRAKRVQPFPDIQLALYDTDGRMTAFRQFRPGEYLDKSIPISAGMTPGLPVHIVLEVTGPTQDAVSFEFRFL